MAVQEPDVGYPGLNGVGLGQGEHVGAGVQSVSDAVRGDPSGGEQDVQAAAGAEVQHGLARLEAGHGHRVAAAEAGAQRRLRDVGRGGIGGGAKAPVSERRPGRSQRSFRGPGRCGRGRNSGQ